MLNHITLCSTFASLFLAHAAAAYTPLARWGQAVAVMDNVLYVQGGKTDEYNAYSYTSAPTVTELLSLDLSANFDSGSTPWSLVSSSSSAPSMAWHTLSGLNSSFALLFGGLPGVDSSPVLTTLADSAWLLNIHEPTQPVWLEEAEAWGGEPARRIHHSTVTLPSGHVFIFGGETANGSEDPITTHYQFDPYKQTFSQISTDDGPSDITGHASVILGNGSVLVFGGYHQSTDTMIPFSTIWTIDTGLMSQNVTWNTMSVSTSSLPTPRRAFAATCLGGDKVLIHGGSDSDYLNTYSDGWILDLSHDPATWTQVAALSSIGARRDHFAVAVGTEVIIGFGYGSSGPADSALVFYDSSAGTMGSSYVPPSSTAASTATMPGTTTTSNPSQTTGTAGGVSPTSTVGSNGDGGGNSGGNGGSGSDNGGSGGGGSGGGGSGGGGGGSGGGGDGSGGGDGNGSGGGGNPIDSGDPNNGSGTTAIAIGTTLGVLGTFALVVVVVWYMRRQRREDGRFTMLNDNGADDDNDSPFSATSAHRLPVAGAHDQEFEGWTLLRSVGLAGAARAFGTRRLPERRDMLADEDTRVFMPGYQRNESAWSLRSILGGGSRRNRQQPSGASSLGTPWGDKDDPFSDRETLMTDAELGMADEAHSARPSGRRQFSHTSSLSNPSYHDPFSDPLASETRYRDLSDDETDDHHHGFSLSDPPPPPRLALQTMLPMVYAAHTLSPVTEASRQSLNADSSTSSHSDVHSPFDSASRATSRTSYEARSPRPSSIIDPAPKPMRRSDSWWNRFSRTSLLDRHNSGSSRRGTMLDFRDPNPPPRLIAIEESTHSAHSNSPESAEKASPTSNTRMGSMSRKASKVYGAHGKSTSSLRTVDSEAIERMGGVMDVAQRVRTGSNRTRESTATSLSVSSEDPREKAESFIEDEHPLVMSPVESTSAGPPLVGKTTPSPPVSLATSSSTSHGSTSRPSSVADRVREFERRMSKDVSPPPTNTKQKEERRKPPKVDYGLVPRASLYVANPDHRQASSGSS